MKKITYITMVMVLFLSCVFVCVAEEMDAGSDIISDWSGTWNCDVNTLNLTQDGNLVIGIYDKPEDMVVLKMEGNVSEDGKVFSGSWSDTGKIEFILSDDGKSFNGTYVSSGLNNVDYDSDNTWNGTLLDEADPEHPWSGSWDSGMNSITNLSQDDNAVYGSYVTPGDVLLTIDGLLSEDGKKLIGTYSDEGLFIFTLSEDGNSFNGTFGYGSEDSTRSWNGTRAL